MKPDVPAGGARTWLARVMAAGAVYDGVFALAILGPTRAAASLLGLTVPPDPLYLYLDGVLLLILAGLYTLPAVDPQRYHAVAPISAAGRLLGFGLFLWGWSEGRTVVFLVLGLADLAIAGGTLWAWVNARRVTPSV